MSSRYFSLIGWAGWVGACFLAAALGTLFTGMSVGTWYRELSRPSWGPPNWVFAPVWTTLYMLMGTAAWLVWQKHGFRGASAALILFIVQLALNAGWSFLFFGLRLPGLAFVELIILWVAILLTIMLFWGKILWAGVLLLPYLAWVSFAGVLNYAIWRLNS